MTHVDPCLNRLDPTSVTNLDDDITESNDFSLAPVPDGCCHHACCLTIADHNGQVHGSKTGSLLCLPVLATTVL